MLSAAAAAALSIGVAALPAAPLKFVAFRTPSGNIGCAYAHFSGEAPYLRCDIRSGLKPRPRPSRPCDGEYGDSLSMAGTGRAHPICHGDTTFDPAARVVRYGTSIRLAPFACTSRVTGLTCTNASGHGWFLSRESYRLF